MQVLEDPQSVTVRLINRTMFASGSAELNPSAMPLLTRIGQAVRDEPGNVLVNGYTDNQPIRTVRFPSNWQLSQARAEAVAKVLAAQLPTDRPVQRRGQGRRRPAGAQHQCRRTRTQSPHGDRAAQNIEAAMKTFYARIVRSRWLTTLLGVLLLGLVVWFFGPLLAVGITRPLETELARGGVIGACLLAWLVWNLMHVWQARKRDKALVDGVAAEQVDPSEAALGRRGGAAGRPAARGAACAEARQAGRPVGALSVSASLVPVHRAARRRQDHGADQLRPALSAGRHVRPGRDARRGWHPQLRLVVHRPGGD